MRRFGSRFAIVGGSVRRMRHGLVHVAVLALFVMRVVLAPIKRLFGVAVLTRGRSGGIDSIMPCHDLGVQEALATQEQDQEHCDDSPGSGHA